jgi:hypothetical protein
MSLGGSGTLTIYSCGCAPQLDEHCKLAERRVQEARCAAASRSYLPRLAGKQAKAYAEQERIATEWVAEHLRTQERVGNYKVLPQPGNEICAECNEHIPSGKEVDHGYRVGDSEVTVERWVCPACDEAMYDDAVGRVP